MLTVRLLGAPELLQDGGPVSVPRRKSRALVFYLAAHGAPVRRDALLALFWPDAGRAAAQQTLRTTLHGLRKILGPALLADDETLALAPEVAVDARQFEAGLRSAADAPALVRALALYRGDFLAGFTLPDAAGFDDWVAVERERFRRLAVRGLTTLSGKHEAQQDFTSALEALERALAFDPLQEDLQRAALRLHYLAGDRAGAIRRYETLRRLLDEEMGVPPMAETRALYDAILTDALDKSPALSPKPQAIARSRPSDPGDRELGFVPPFTGRAAELETLRALTAAHKLALIEGEPGIGKSRLADEFMRSAGGLALTGAAHELETALPYQPVREALRSLLPSPDWAARRDRLCAEVPPLWRAEAARLFPELDVAGTAAPSTADESRLWEGFFQFLLVLAQPGGLTLFLDDLQWADVSTLSLLGYLVRRAEAVRAPIFFLAAARPYAARSPLAALIQALTREGRLVRLALTRLAADDVLNLARHLSPDFAQPLSHWLLQNSEGNPYILAELVRTLRDQGLLRPDGALNLPALPGAPTVPPSVYSLIQSRLARLSEPARRVLDAAVAAGREFEFDVVARAAGLSETAALDALDELRAAHLVLPVAGGTRFVFDHSLTMEVAYHEVGEPRHRLLHRRIAEALESLGRDRSEGAAGLLAWHFIEGGAPERAAPYAFRAGQQAARLAAWTEAAAFYEQALAGADDRQRLPTLLALGAARFQAGQAAQAAEVLQSALAEAGLDPAQRDEVRQLLAQNMLNQGRYADVIALAHDLLREAAGAPERAVTAELFWGTALSLEGADLAAAAEHLQRAETLLRSAIEPDPARLAQTKFELGSVAAQQGDLPRAIAFYREALAVADAHEPLVVWRVLACNNLAYHLHLLGEPEAPAYLQRGLALAREAGFLNMLPFLLSTQGELALAAGDLAAAEAAFTEGLGLAEQLGNAERLAGLTANLGRLAARRGDTALAIHRLSTALARADALGTQHLAAQIRLWLAPLLPANEARSALAQARAIAENGGRRRLLDEVKQLEQRLPSPA